MGFGGGGGGALPNHEHSLLPLDGGPLDLAGVTVGSMNSGDLTFSDGAALQTLTYPAVPAGETLTAAALSTAPSWGAGSGSNFEFLGSSTITAGSPLTLTLSSAVANPDYVIATFAGQPASGQAVDYQVNGINSSTYNSQGTYFIGGGNNNQNISGASFFQGISSSITASNDAVLYFKIFTNPLSDTIFTQSESYTSSNGYTIYGGFNSTAAQTDITSITCLGNAFSGTLSAWAVRN